MTTKTKAPMRDAVSKAKAPMREGLAALNEFLDSNNLAGSISSALERSEVVIAAESIVDKLQGIAEDLSTIEAKDIMPLLDSLSTAFGPEAAQNFNSIATEQVRQLITSVQGAKTALDTEIVRLKQAVESGNVSDMAMDGGSPMMPSGEPGMEPGAEPGAVPGAAPAAGALPDVPTDTAGNAEDDSLEMGGNFAGREKKEAVESAKPRTRKRRIAEDGMMPHSHESVNLDPNIANLHLFHGAAGKLADKIKNLIRTEELSLDQRKALANVLSNMSGFGSDPAHWADEYAGDKVDWLLKRAGIWDKEMSPAVEKIVALLRRLGYRLSLAHEDNSTAQPVGQMLESNIAMLRKASDPDGVILRTFRTKLAEGRDAQMAAIRTARAFAIDIEDVVAVVKEAAERRPVREFKAGNPAKKGMFKGKRGVKEDGPPLMQGVPMFPVELGTAASSTVSNPMNAPTNAQPQTPPEMVPPNQSASTNKPLSPADMRAKQGAEQQQDAMAQQGQPSGQPQQPPQGQGQPQQPQQPQPNKPPQSGQSSSGQQPNNTMPFQPQGKVNNNTNPRQRMQK